jgi:hypothetical protein
VFVGTARRPSAQRAFDAWRRALAELGLEAHEGKTRWSGSSRGRGALLAGSGSELGGDGRDIIAAP